MRPLGPAWNPHIQAHSQQLEKIQRRSARFVLQSFDRTSSVTAMLEHLRWPQGLLSQRRVVCDLVLFYRVVQGLVACTQTNYLVPIPVRSSSRHTHKYAFRRFEWSKAYTSSTFFPRSIVAWNGLPVSIMDKPSISAFKTALEGHFYFP